MDYDDIKLGFTINARFFFFLDSYGETNETKGQGTESYSFSARWVRSNS